MCVRRVVASSMCPVEIMKSLKAQMSKAPITQCAQASLNTSQCYFHMCPSQKQLSIYQLRSVAVQAEHLVAGTVACTSAVLPLLQTAVDLHCNPGSLKEGAAHCNLEKKSIAKQMSRKDCNEFAEPGIG